MTLVHDLVTVLRHRLVQFAALVALIVAIGAAKGVAHTGEHIAFSYEVVKHFDGLTPGCFPTINFTRMYVDAEGVVRTGWQQGNCGLPHQSPGDAGIVVAARDAGGWLFTTLTDALCGFDGCSAIHQRPALAVHPDGRPFLVFAAPGGPSVFDYSIYSLNLLSGKPADRIQVLGPHNSSDAFPMIAAAFPQVCTPDQLPNIVQVPHNGHFGGPMTLNGTAISNTLGSWIDYAVGGQDSHHIAVLAVVAAQGGQGVYYSAGPARPLALVLLTTQSSGGSIAVDAAGRRHIAHAGGPSGNGNFDTRLFYVSSDDGINWTPELVDATSAQKPAIAIDPEGQPAIAYWTGGKDLWLARRIGGVWTRTLVATTAGGHGSIDPQLRRTPTAQRTCCITTMARATSSSRAVSRCRRPHRCP